MRWEPTLFIIIICVLLTGLQTIGDEPRADGAEQECGSDLIWAYSSGVLSITGTGSMYNYTDVDIPWRSHSSSIREIFVSDGVTSIGNYAFYNCSAMNTMSLPDSIKRIGSHAFDGCKGLTTLTIPEGVTTISPDSFNNCTNIKTLEYDADSCSDFTTSPFTSFTGFKVIVGTSVSTIPANFLNGCTPGDVSISSYVMSIEDRAFYNCKSTITLGNNSWLSNVGDYAFYSCVNADIAIPSGVRTIGNHAFDGCISVTAAEFTKIQTIGNEAMQNCISITNLTLPSSLTKIGTLAFYGCTSLREIVFDAPNLWALSESSRLFENAGNGSGTTIHIKTSTVPNYLLAGAKAISSAVINSKVTSIGDNAFNGFDGKIVYENELDSTDRTAPGSKVISIGSKAFYDSGLERIYIQKDLQSIGAGAFDACDNVTDIWYNAESLTTTANTYFGTAGSINGMSVHIGDNVTVIPASAFEGSNVAMVNLNKVVKISERAFAETDLKAVSVPSTVETIGGLAFDNNQLLTEIAFYSSTTVVDEHCFRIEGPALSTHVSCYRKALQTDYSWTEDNRRIGWTFMHTAGEYTGMMEVIFDSMSMIVGEQIANSIIDFFIDPIALDVIESIDLGSKENNQLLLLVITIFLLSIVFVALFFDKSEAIRIVEVLLSFAFIIIVIWSSLRRIWTLPENITIAVVESVLLVAGLAIPVFATIEQITHKPEPYSGETFVRLYTIDKGTFKSMVMSPWRSTAQVIEAALEDGLFLWLLVLVPGGVALSVLFSLMIMVTHVPAFLSSLIIAKVFTEKDRNTGKHTNDCVCPDCGSRFPKPLYECEKCGTKHDGLAPGIYGAHKCTCRCGAAMPCTVKGHRWEHSRAHCPDCKREMMICEAEPFAISVVGGTGSGKTTMIANSLDVFDREITPKHGLDCVFIGNKDTDGFIQQSRQGRAATPGGYVPPYTALFSSKKSNRDFRTAKALYYYDINGCEFTSDKNNGEMFQTNYKNNEGIIMTIDPHTLSEWCAERGVAPSLSCNPDDVFDNFSRIYFQMNEKGPTDAVDTPIAIVVTYARDADLELSRLENMNDESYSDVIREFLIDNGASNMVNSISTKFKNVRYFASDVDSDSAIVPSVWITCMVNEKLTKWLGTQ